jgi:positive regulator of sigma E activity
VEKEMSQCAAVVIVVSGDHVWVEVPARKQACANCPTPGSCQTGLLGLSSRPRRYRLDNELNLRVGDPMDLVVADGILWRAALASYLIPALLAIGGAVIGQWWMGDVAAMAGMCLGLLFGFALLRHHESHACRARSPLFLQHSCSTQKIAKENP